MTRDEALELFTGSVVSATIDAPDNYPDWHPGYKDHRDQLRLLWHEVKSKLKQDLDKAAFIDEKLPEAIASFDCGERQPGQRLMFEIYNVLNQGKLR